MPQEFLEVKRDRFHLLNPNLYILQGIFPDDYIAVAYLDTTSVPVREESWEISSVSERFLSQNRSGAKRITLTISLPDNLHTYRRLTVYAVDIQHRIRWFTVSVKELIKKQGKPYYYIEENDVDAAAGGCRIRGWVVYKEPVTIEVLDHNKQKLSSEIQRTIRKDVEQLYSEGRVEEKPGFYLELTGLKSNLIYLVFRSGEEKSVYPIETTSFAIFQKKTSEYIKKAERYFKTYGTIPLLKKVFGKLIHTKDKPVVYSNWIQKHLPDEHQLQKQRKTKMDWEPMFSVVVPLYKTPKEYLNQMIESVRNQSYTNWELILSDGSGENSPIKAILETFMKMDHRIQVIHHSQSLNISQNTNAAIEKVKGDYVVFMDHDDELTPNALFEAALLLNQKTDTDLIYSDEDKMTTDGRQFFQPHFKPDFNLDLLCTVNYICHLFIVKKALIEQIGMLNTEFDGAQDYDFIFRCIESTERIAHIPKILYHWRSHEASTAENPESKSYAFDAGARAVQAHYERLGIPAYVEKGEYLGLYRTKYLWEEHPLISIIIPNKDHIEDLKRCMDSIDTKSTYRNYEYIIVENNSTEEETFNFYKELQSSRNDVKVVYYQNSFNFSDINNYGSAFAEGKYYLLLNNDTEIINPDCLEELLGYCMREDVGVVGARLYYEDDTIQHAGVVIGFGGIAGHCFVQQPRKNSGYFHRIICAQDYSAVTAACMMVKKTVFDEVHGLSTELAVAFNDIDFCMKVGRAGYRVVYNPYAELYHYESKSRGLEDTPEKKARFNQEIAIFDQRWPDILKHGDPYYNPNLSLETQDFSLKRI